MPKVAVLDMAGKEVSSMELSDAIFGIKPNESVMHQMVVNYLANQRQGTQSTPPVQKCAAAAESLGNRKAPAMQDKVPQEHRNGLTAESR